MLPYIFNECFGKGVCRVVLVRYMCKCNTVGNRHIENASVARISNL